MPTALNGPWLAASTSIWDCNCSKFHDENCGNTRNLRSSTNNEGNVACEGRFHIEPDLSELSSRPSLASPNLSAVPSWHPFDPQTCSWTTNVPTAYQVSRRHSMDLIATKVTANREITWGRQKKAKNGANLHNEVRMMVYGSLAERGYQHLSCYLDDAGIETGKLIGIRLHWDTSTMGTVLSSH